MIANRSGGICVLTFGLLTAGLCGCEEKLPALFPFSTPPAEEHGFVTPTARKRNLQDLIAKAPQTTDPAQREAICQDLAQQIRKEPDSDMRGWIIRTLAAYGGPPGGTADRVLNLAVKDTDADVRIVVCNVWGQRADSEAVQVLETVLSSDSDRDVRMAAARALGHSKDPAAVRALAPALDDTDPAMRYRAMVALREATGKSIGTDPSDVVSWRQYLKTGQEPEQSWAQRVCPWLY